MPNQPVWFVPLLGTVWLASMLQSGDSAAPLMLGFASILFVSAARQDWLATRNPFVKIHPFDKES